MPASAVIGFAPTEPDLHNEARQHLLNALRRFHGSGDPIPWGEGGALAQIELELELPCRAKCDAQEGAQVLASRSSAILGDVQSNEDRRAAKLAREVESLTRWKCCRNGVYFEREVSSLLVYVQPPMILHAVR